MAVSARARAKEGWLSLMVTGNHAAAWAVKAARVQVVAAYPITPQTTIVEKIAEFVEKGELKAEYIRVESEHSAMTACIGASAAGARAFTATAAHGLALMHECLWWAAGARLPIVMAVVNRAMGPGWNIWTDYCDTMAQRDLGWVQIYCADNQEVFDSIIQAYRLAEDPRVMLPVMVDLEAFILSHTYMPVHVPPQDEIDDWLPPYKPAWTLDPEEPITHGNLVFPAHYMEFRYLMQEAMENVKELLPKIGEDYKRRFGLTGLDFVETYRCEDADALLLTMGTMGVEARITVDRLRERGHKIGLARVRVFRPFPVEQIRGLARGVEKVVVIDRHISYGAEGALAMETKWALYPLEEKPMMTSFIAGIGGRDVTYKDMETMALKALEWMERGQPREGVWYGVRGLELA